MTAQASTNETAIRQNDTGVGPTSPGRWAAIVGDDGTFTLVCTEDADGALSWVWDDQPDHTEDVWTPGWPCAALA